MVPPQILIVVFAFLATTSYGLENLKLVYQWKQIDFDFPSMKARQDAIISGKFVQKNNLPLGLEVYKDRLFVTVPRWKSGVAASLTYIDLKDKSESPILHPYPNWEAHQLPENREGAPQQIVSPFRVRADRCGRLWILDTGTVDIVGNKSQYVPTQVLIYDLSTDELIRQYTIPANQRSDASFLANLVVEDEDCTDSYGYFGDLGDPAVVVYSFKMNSSWRIKHHYFFYNPLYVEFEFPGMTFIWLDGIFGMGLSKPGPDGVSTLYFHPMAGTHEFAVSTRHLRNASLAESNFHKFRVIGSRGPNGQSSVAFLDKKTGVYFYALVTQNTIACWRSTNQNYTMENQGRIFENPETMIFPNDIKVDANDNIWVLSDRLPIFLNNKLNLSDVNFRIFSAPVSEAIKGTPCAADDAVSSNTPSPTTISPAAISDVFNKFNRPTQKPGTSPDKLRPPVQAFAIAEIPEMGNNFKPPSQQPHFTGNPDLTFMYKPFPLSLPGPTVINSFQPPTKVPAEMTINEEGNGKKGFEILVNVPVNLYLSVESP